MDILLNNAHSSLITITLITLFLFFIKNKLINVIFALSQKTNTVYDELILFSIKTPSTYLIIFGYIFVITDYFNKNEVLNLSFSLSSAVFSLIVIVISWSLLRGLNYYLQLKPFTKNLSSEDDITLITETYEIVVRILKILVVVITALIIMQEIGLSISGLLAFGGVGGLIVGLAAKDLLSNFFGGMMIFFDRPFRVGEFIKSPDRNIEGIVEKIGWRLTVVRTFSKNVLYIPNTAFSSIIVELSLIHI